MTRAWFNALAQKGRAATVTLERHDQALACGLDEWFALKPSRMSDVRRLLGAVLLIAPSRARSPARVRARILDLQGERRRGPAAATAGPSPPTRRRLEQRALNGGEAAPVVAARAELPDRRAMRAGGVPTLVSQP